MSTEHDELIYLFYFQGMTYIYNYAYIYLVFILFVSTGSIV